MMGWSGNILTEAYPTNFPALTESIPEAGALLAEINASGITTAECQSVACDSGVCSMTFDTEPSAGDKTTIAGVITSHTGEVAEGSQPESSEDFRLVDATDTTKEVDFDLSNLSTETTRTLTIPDGNITLDDANDPRDPNAHESSHRSGQSDAIKLDDLAVPDDNTDLNASTSAHGLLRKLSGTATQYLDGSGAWSTPSGGGGSALPTDYITGLGISRNSSNPNYQIDIATGKCRSDDDTTDIVASSIITVDITSSGANGLDTGSEASSTWYFVWLIYNPTTETTAGLLSASSSSPTMPSGYTKKRYIGSTFNNASSNFRKWVQYIAAGNLRCYDYYQEEDSVTVLLLQGDDQTWTDIDCSDFVPPTTEIVHIGVTFYAAVVTDHAFVRAKGETQSTTAAEIFGGDTGAGSNINSAHWIMRTDSSQIIQYIIDGVSSCELSLAVSGYTELI